MTDPSGPGPDPLSVLRTALGGQYEVERLLGQGGMGSVYLGRDRTLDRPVAIKVINPEVAANATLRARFLQEARTVARLRHANIVPVYAAGEADGMLYFVMEYVPGQSLRELIDREGRLPPARVAAILGELAQALHHAHGQGLIHRDVKPENVLLDAESGRAMLTDFGVARAMEQDGGVTQAGMVLGSPRYMSPEQASGDAIDGRSDLYSLALVGYEMLDGTPVVQAATAAAMLVKHLTETPPPIAARVAGVPASLALAIDRGLAKDPERRWQTGREFAEAVTGAPIATGTVPLAAGSVLSTRGRLVAAVAAAAVVIGGLWFALGRSTETDRGFLIAPFEIQSGDPSVAWLREGSVNMLTLTLGQWSDLNVVDYERTLSLLDAEGVGDKARLSLDDALAVARRAQAGTVVTGQVQTTADSLIVIARLFDVRSGTSARQAQVASALAADPRPVFDELAQQLLAIGGTDRVSTMQLAQATTSSLEAYRAYLDGVRHLNAWRLREADAEFARAVALDSSFALAHHKRSVGLGWAEAGGPAYVESARRAHELADRLPPRERALVEGHYQIVRGLSTSGTGDTAAARQAYLASIAAYQGLIGRGDSLVAEAWYGLADAYFHARAGIPGLGPDSIGAWTTRSLRGFHRTLAIDSTWHLAYSHLVQLYNESGQNTGLLISGDSAILLSDAAATTRLGGPQAVERLRTAATLRGVEISRAWARSDNTSTQPVLQLAQSLLVAGQPDSAVAVLDRALGDPRLGTPLIRLTLLTVRMSRGDTALSRSVREALARYTPDSMRTIPVGQRLNLGGALVTAAAMTGSTADVDRARTLVVATDSVFPFTAVPTGPTMDLNAEVLQVAMGAPMAADFLVRFRARLQNVLSIPGPAQAQLRATFLSPVYLVYLETRDTTLLGLIREWTPGTALTELDALAALAAGDTAGARRIAASFPSPDSLRNPVIRFGSGGLRSVARAEVLAAVGMTRQAVLTLEATDIERINRTGLAEPGYVVWVRGWLLRARLWAQLGELDRARTGYEEFLRRWANADGPAEALVRQAREELGRLRDRE